MIYQLHNGWINTTFGHSVQLHILLCRRVGLPSVRLNSFPSCLFFPLCCRAHVLIRRFFAFSHGLTLFPKSMSLCIPPPCSHTHSVFKSKDSPCVMQAVSFPLSFYLPPLSLSLLPPSLPPQNVWIDLNGVIVTALPAVCPSTSASQRLWKV